MANSKTAQTIVLLAIGDANDPDCAHIEALSIEQRVRLAIERFIPHEEELARQRKSEARIGRGLGLPITSKRGKSIAIAAQKVGMKTTTFSAARAVIEFADWLKLDGRIDEAQRLLQLLNTSVSGAKRERDRLLDQIKDEAAVQAEVREMLAQR